MKIECFLFCFSGEINHAINLSKPKIMFVTKTNLTKYVKVSKQNSFIKQIISLDDLPNNSDENVTTLKEIMKTVEFRPFDEFHCQPQNWKDNVSLILCSSGTTGLPKGVQLTQFNILMGDLQHL